MTFLTYFCGPFVTAVLNDCVLYSYPTGTSDMLFGQGRLALKLKCANDIHSFREAGFSCGRSFLCLFGGDVLVLSWGGLMLFWF